MDTIDTRDVGGSGGVAVEVKFTAIALRAVAVHTEGSYDIECHPNDAPGRSLSLRFMRMLVTVGC